MYRCCTAAVLQLDTMEVLYRALRGADVTNAEAITHYLPQPSVHKMMVVRIFEPAVLGCIQLMSRVPCSSNWVAPVACEKSMCFVETQERPCSSQHAAALFLSRCCARCCTWSAGQTVLFKQHVDTV